MVRRPGAPITLLLPLVETLSLITLLLFLSDTVFYYYLLFLNAHLIRLNVLLISLGMG